MNPLMIEGCIGKSIDLILIDGMPRRAANHYSFQ
jgi:hypothetical protein